MLIKYENLTTANCWISLMIEIQHPAAESIISRDQKLNNHKTPHSTYYNLVPLKSTHPQALRETNIF